MTAIPLLSKFLPSNLAAYGFPPLGNVDGIARVGTIVFAVACTYMLFFARIGFPKSTGKSISTAIAAALLSFVLYLGLFLAFVRTIEIPSRDTAVQVSIGYARSEFARATFGDASDWQLLKERGPSEEEIWSLWTPSSIIISRMCLFMAYTLTICFLVLAFSFGVRAESASSVATH